MHPLVPRPVRLLPAVLVAAVAALALGIACEEERVVVTGDFVEPVASPETDDSNEILALEREAEAAVDAIRQDEGLVALEPDETLREIARGYSCLMAREGFFDHTGPEGATVDDRVWAADIEFRGVGENLAMVQGAPDPVSVAVGGWMESDSHRENLLRDDWEETAIGVCIEGEAYYFTQIFLLRS